MGNNRKATRGRRQIFIPRTVKVQTATGPVTLQDPRRMEKYFICKLPNGNTFMSKSNW
jgi:hypothetical protein